jgi:hypothetical protein
MFEFKVLLTSTRGMVSVEGMPLSDRKISTPEGSEKTETMLL